MKSLVGYTGFVGSNLAQSAQFTHFYNSKNIEEAYGTSPDLLVYAGVRAEKFLANSSPEKDLQTVQEAFMNIQKINPKRVVLISTIDVYKNPVDVDEDSVIETDGLQPYGLNRYRLEQWVRDAFPNSLTVRLPGLYGKNIKKNFIYDLIHVIPSMLSEKKYMELHTMDEMIPQCYVKQENGFYKCRPMDRDEDTQLKKVFEKIGFSALNFTDSRGKFQFYNLKFLAGHIQTALSCEIPLLNLTTEPIEIAELYRFIKGENFINHITDHVPGYDFKSRYAGLLGGGTSYIFTKDFVLQDIKEFVEGYDCL